MFSLLKIVEHSDGRQINYVMTFADTERSFVELDEQLPPIA